jgi:hypothetical protein
LRAVRLEILRMSFRDDFKFAMAIKLWVYQTDIDALGEENRKKNFQPLQSSTAALLP